MFHEKICQIVSRKQGFINYKDGEHQGRCREPKAKFMDIPHIKSASKKIL